MKEGLHPPLEDIGFKSEFGFDTAATISRTKAKRIGELLNPISSNGGFSFLEHETQKLKSEGHNLNINL